MQSTFQIRNHEENIDFILQERSKNDVPLRQTFVFKLSKNKFKQWEIKYTKPTFKNLLEIKNMQW